MKTNKQFTKYIELLDQDRLTYRDILNLNKLLNGRAATSLTDDELRAISDKLHNRGDYLITPEQTEQGLQFLLNEWKTPRGIERKNNPFGFRETNILENFSHFVFNGFYDLATYSQSRIGIKNLTPLYTVKSKEMNTFQYYMAYNGAWKKTAINIVG